MLETDIWPIVITLTIVVITVIFFTLGKFRSDIIAVCALLSFMLFGILTPQEALSGFSNNIILTIAGMFIVGGAIVRTGLANTISSKILKFAGENHNVLFMLIMLVTAAVGSLVSNTGTVAIMMPIVVSMALSIQASPGRFLMPVAFMSSMGGMLTLIGNPANMVVNDAYVKAGYPSLKLFSFLPIGLVCIAFGLFILAPVTSYFLSRRKTESPETLNKGPSLKELADKYKLAQHMYKIAVPSSTSVIGSSLKELNLTGKYGIVIHEIRRSKRQQNHFAFAHVEQVSPNAQTAIMAGDIIYALGSLEKLKEFAEDFSLNLITAVGSDDTKEKYRFDSIGICELVLMSSSQLINHMVAESNLREQYGITVLSIQRGDQYIMDNIKEQTMQAGDALLVQGSWENLARLSGNSNQWVVVGKPDEIAESGSFMHKMPYVAAVLTLMITIMATGVLPTVTTVMLAAVAVIAGRCFKNIEEAYSFINWETIVMISCMLPMALAMEKTGLVGIASRYMAQLGAEHGPFVALAAVYSITSVLNIIISSTPVSLLLAPVAIQLAIDLNCSPLPFLLAVATSACMCFASPFSTPSNTLVMSAGRYTFFDYLKIGLPMQALLAVIMIYILPIMFPFH